MKTITETLLTGPAVLARLDDLASLRLDIFREYPYLYQGRREDELTYLGGFAGKTDACVLLACDGPQTIGAATGVPLSHADPQLLAAFAGTSFQCSDIFYVGELLFRPKYRHRGLGQRLQTRLEEHVRSLGSYSKLTCVTIEHPEDHPLCPPDHIPIERFLARTGFVRLPGVTAHLTWREPDGIRRPHTMQFWLKPLMD